MVGKFVTESEARGKARLSDPCLGVGEFQVEAAKAHPFDPAAFLPMWSDEWRKRF
jgi:hypothetical protein